MHRTKTPSGHRCMLQHFRSMERYSTCQVNFSLQLLTIFVLFTVHQANASFVAGFYSIQGGKKGTPDKII